MSPPESTSDEGAEELARPGRRASVRRLRLDIAVAAAVLIGVVLLTRHYGNSGPAAPAPTPSASTAPPVGTSSAVSAPNPFSNHAGRVARCPEGLRCERFAGATLGMHAALAAAFPSFRVLHARTMRIDVPGYGTALWRSDVQARAGDEIVRLRVQLRGPDDGERHGTKVLGARSITHWEGVLRQLRVVIDVVAPANGPAPLAAVEQLARDARLASPW
jgi:hypothetical protein